MKSGDMVITLTREGQGHVYMGLILIYANENCQLGEYLRVQSVGCGTLRQKAANELH